MGLDMYLSLTAKATPENKTLLTKLADDSYFLLGTSKDGTLVTICGLYWRKANAIHAWFVDNVQGGVDECQEFPVSKEQLQELVDVAAKAYRAYKKGDYETATQLLRPRSGFFFGSTDVDKYYADDLKRTSDRIKYLLRETKNKDLEFFYQSSW